MYILSQILVIISDVFLIISMFRKDKKNVVLYLMLSTILFVAHYICLGGWTGAAIGIVDLVFLILMYVLELKDKTKYTPYLCIATMVITIGLSILTWDSWISLLPMTAMLIYLATMMLKNVILVKTGTFLRLTMNGTYMLLIKSYFGAGLTIVILTATIIGIVIDYKHQKKQSLKESKAK